MLVKFDIKKLCCRSLLVVKFRDLSHCQEVAMLNILLKLKESEIKTIETNKAEITIGRISGSDIHIDNLGVSKQHAKIVKHRNTYVIEDLNSTNGTFLNGKKITRAELKDKDVVSIGKHSLIISYRKKAKESPNQCFADKTVALTK
jgi:pSer/pThr/pTyr-binding forkhead associated (FHA) protein